jgi:hypothetical protein
MKPTEEITESEMLEELKTWDDEVWKRFKEQNYETINLSFQVDCD